MTQLLHGNTVHLGNIDSSRDFTYVSDTAKGMILASIKKKAVGETINIGSGGDITIRDLVYLIADLLNKKNKTTIKHDGTRLRPYDVNRLFCDHSKAKRLLEWEPTVPIKEGLMTTLNWIKNNPSEFKVPFKGWPRYFKK